MESSLAQFHNQLREIIIWANEKLNILEPKLNDVVNFEKNLKIFNKILNLKNTCHIRARSLQLCNNTTPEKTIDRLKDECYFLIDKDFTSLQNYLKELNI